MLNPTHKVSSRSPYSKWLWVLFLVLVGVNVYWFALDDRPPLSDASVHLTTAYDYYDIFRHPSWTNLKRLPIVGEFYPTLFHVCMSFFFLLFGPSNHSGPAANLIALAVLLLFTFRLGRNIFNDEVGAWAAALAATYPVMAWLAREALLDFAAAAVVVATYFYFVASENFSRRGTSFSFGLAYGLALLTKHNAVFYLALLTLYGVIRVARAAEDRARRFKNFAWAHGIAFALAALWYVPHGNSILEYVRVNRQLHVVLGQPEFFSASSLLYLASALTSTHLWFLFSLLFVVGLIHSLQTKARACVSLYLGALGSIALMTFLLPHREIRMAVPSLPFIAILSVSWLPRISRVVLKKTLWVCMGLMAALQYFLISFGTHALKPERFLLKHPSFEITLWSQHYAHVVGPPRKENWQMENLLRAANEEALRRGMKRFALGVVPDTLRFHFYGLRWYARRMKIPAEVFRVADMPERDKTFDRVSALITKSGDQGVPGTTQHNAEVMQWVVQHPEVWTLIRQFPLEDGSEARLYFRNF